MKTILFDFDYTLVDSSDAIVDCFLFAFEKLGIELPERLKIKKLIGLPLEDMFIRSVEPSEREKVQLFRQYYKEKADVIMNRETKAFEDTRQTLEYLSQKGYNLGIVSTKYRYRIKEWLEMNDFVKYFKALVGGEDVDQHKPSPEGIIRAFSYLNTPRLHVCYVGDSVMDYQAAASAKLLFIPVLTGQTTLEDFRQAGFEGDFVAEKLSDLMDYFQSPT